MTDPPQPSGGYPDPTGSFGPPPPPYDPSRQPPPVVSVPVYQQSAPPYPLQPPVQPYGAPPPGYPPPKKGWGPGRIVIVCVAGLAGLCLFGSVIAAIAGSPKPKAAAPATAAPSATTTTKVAAAETTEPAARTPAPKPTVTKPKPVSFKKLSSREWLKIAKDPDGHIGEAIVVYGSVTQFDSATGTDTFRADVGASNQEYSFSYPTNTVLTGDATGLQDVVEDDEFKANVIVTGSLSYETTLGGETTVPQLEVKSLRVL